MNDTPGSRNPRASRRRVLQTISGLTTLGVLGAGSSTTVAADPGDQQWRFETDGGVGSSPTVVDGTVFVGSSDNISPAHVYALDAADGTEQWRFETDDRVWSSPTVVDGTVFVGSLDDDVYALDAGVEGSSEDSRVNLGTLGHHDGWTGEMPLADFTPGNDRSVADLEASEIEITFENKFATESPDGALETLYAGVSEAMPLSDPTEPDENEAYIHVDVRVAFPNDVANSITAVRPRLTHDQTDETFRPSNLAPIVESSDTVEYPGRGPELTELESSVHGWNDFRIRTPTQVGISGIEAVLLAVSLKTGVELPNPVRARTEAYPDAYIHSLEIESDDGEQVEITVDERIPRYDDVCPQADGTYHVSALLNEECSVGELGLQGGGVVMSPATIAAKDDQGRVTGRIWDGDEYRIYDEIPGAIYSGPLRHEFVLVPDGDYELILDGQTSGEATVIVDQLTDDAIRSARYEDIEVTESVRLQSELASEELGIDRGRTGDVEEQFSPTAVTETSAEETVGARLERIGTDTADDSTDQTRTDDRRTDDSDDDDRLLDSISPGVGVTVAGAAGAAYVLKRRLDYGSDES